MASIISHNPFVANANKVCGGGGDRDLPVVAGTWRDTKLNVSCDSDDDGYSKSDGNDSYHSVHGTIESGNSANSTSGVSSSNRQSENGNGSRGTTYSGRTGGEIVNKILVSREINDAIFKPGKFPLNVLSE